MKRYISVQVLAAVSPPKSTTRSADSSPASGQASESQVDELEAQIESPATGERRVRHESGVEFTRVNADPSDEHKVDTKRSA